MPKYIYYNKDDTVPFGKYADWTFNVLVNRDPYYLAWMIENCDILVSSNVHRTLVQALEHESKRFHHFIKTPRPVLPGENAHA